MNEAIKPYVVSADVKGLMDRWTRERGYVSPSEGFYKELETDLRLHLLRMFAAVDVVDYDYLRTGLNRLCTLAKKPVISLDRAYLTYETPNLLTHIDATRAVNPEFKKIGLMSRPGTPSLEKQYEALASPDVSPVVLADDVIFGGDGVIEIAAALKKVNRPVVRVIAGIGIQEGVDKIQAQGIPVTCVVNYPDVVDEVCQRDFVAGVPMSGRTVISTDNSHWSAPYFRPFGDAQQWATIPAERDIAFTIFCLTQSTLLWSEVEKLSNKLVHPSRAPRNLALLEDAPSLASALASVLNTLSRTNG